MAGSILETRLRSTEGSVHTALQYIRGVEKALEKLYEEATGNTLPERDPSADRSELHTKCPVCETIYDPDRHTTCPGCWALNRREP